MKLVRTASVGVWMAVASMACSANVVFTEDDGQGGEGASGASPTGGAPGATNTSITATSITNTGVGGSGGSQPSACNVGNIIDQQACDDCVGLAVGGPCAGVTCDSGQCNLYSDCIISQCNGDEACCAKCGFKVPQGEQEFIAAVECIICGVCALSCEGAFPNVCGF